MKPRFFVFIVYWSLFFVIIQIHRIWNWENRKKSGWSFKISRSKRRKSNRKSFVILIEKFRQSQRTPNEIYLLLNNTNSIVVEQSIYFGYKMLDNKWINEINQFPCSLNTEFRGSALVYSASFDWFDFIYRYPLSTDIRTREKKKWKNEMVKIHNMISISSRCCKYLFNVQMYFCFFLLFLFITSQLKFYWQHN